MKKKNKNNKVLYDLDYSCTVIPRSLGLPDSIAYGPGMMGQQGRSAPSSSCSYLLRESIDWIPGTSPRMTLYGEVGRSMVETLATLAIIGILGMAGVTAYNSAMNRYRANTLINEAQKRAVVVAGQIGFNGREPSLTEFEPYNKTSAGEFKEVTTEGLYKQFGIQVSGVTKPVCQNILNTLGATTPIRRLSLKNTPTTPLTTCNDTNGFLFIYNEDMQGESSDTEYAIDDSSCKSVCGVFNPKTHLCDESDCEIPTNTCTENADCNTENECMVCDTTSGQCKNGCERVEYLESTGTQWINTGITISETDTFSIDYIITLDKNSKRGLIGYSPIRHGYWGIMENNKYELGALDTGVYPKTKDHIVFQRTIEENNSQTHELYINGELGTRTFHKTPETGSLSIFAIGNGGHRVSSGKIFTSKVILNSTPMRDFIPVHAPFQPAGKQNCMFDRVTKQLFCNANTKTNTPDFKTD